MNPVGSVFVDASFWVALRDARDEQHGLAAAVARHIVERRWRLVSTWMVFAESHAPFARSTARKEQVLRDFTANPLMTLVEVTPADRTEALALLRQHADKDYSLCDAVSFVLIRRLGLLRAAAFDDHFRQFGGFEVLG
jgi:uncharacterized protein